MQQPLIKNQETAAPGVIDTISDGFTAIVAQPFFLFPLLAFELYFWLGPTVALSGLGSTLAGWLNDDSPAIKQLSETLTRLGGSDATELISEIVPTLLPNIGEHDLYQIHPRGSVTIESAAFGAIALIGIFLIAALALAIFTVPLADAAASRSRSISALPGAIVRATKRLFGLMLAIGMLAVLVAGPLLVGWVVFSAQGMEIGPVLSGIGFLVGLAAFFVFWFAPEAVVVAEVGPIQALNLSYRVVRANVQPTIAFAAASVVIAAGLEQIWQRLAGTAPGLLLAVIGNAFVASGLAIASMKFFTDRIVGVHDVPGLSAVDIAPHA